MVTGVAVSVVVCTHNRAACLRRCLEALAVQDAPADAYEVLVVDNASDDDTRQLLRSWVGAHPGRSSIREPRLGVGHARNAGVRAAAGEVVAFVDDDALAEPGWVASIIDSYTRHPTAVAIGGPVTLDWGASRPAWMRDDLNAWFSGLDLGPDERVLTPDDTLFGTNFTARRALIEEVGGFDVSLGRIGSGLLSGEEGALVERLRALGDVVYDPRLGVRHVVLPERRTRRWLLRRNYAQGRTDVRRGRVPEPASRLLLGSVADWHRLRTDGLHDVLRRARLVGRARELIARR